MEAITYNNKGKEAGSIELPEKIFGAKWNADLVHQVVTSMLSSRRQGSAHTKDRGEVRGGGRKPWKQKGTGRARHGSIRSPLWRGGGTTFGPRADKNYARKVNRKMSAAALASVLSQKLRDGEILFVESLSLTTPRTKEASSFLKTFASIKGFEKMGARRGMSVVLALPKREVSLDRGFRNIGTVTVEEARNLNAADLLAHRYLAVVDPKGFVEAISARFSK
ncbi:50S ribosomal protein L4 [Candidatus Parcubacteria bacterium]|nr:50S ribosomal protein L4 [Candidatus Parcubacteria bacterium]